MNSRFQFRIIRFEPDPIRAERINIGIVAIRNGSLDIRLVPSSARHTLVKEYGAEEEFKRLNRTLQFWASSENESDADFLLQSLAIFPRWTTSKSGHFFAATDEQYESEISSILEDLVTPISIGRATSTRRRLSSELRDEFQKMGLLGSSSEDFDNGLVIPRYPISFGDASLRVDFAVKARELFFLQAFDLGGVDLSDKVRDVASKALVFNQARKQFDGRINAFFVVRWGDDQYGLQSTCLEIMKGYADRVIDFSNDRDRIQLLADVSRRRGRNRELFSIPRELPRKVS